MTYDLIIVGAGAAGLAAANEARRKGLSFLVLEAAAKPAKKLLATGNGKGNLCNLDGGARYYNTSFVERVLERYPPSAVVGFFEGLGLKTKAAETRVYPDCESSAAVAAALLKNIKKSIITLAPVGTIEKTGEGFTINSEYLARNVLFCTGSNATLGADSLSLLAPFGHRVKPFRPALTPLITETRYIKGLAGIRVKARASLIKGGIPVAVQDGEVLFKDNGISGIAVFMLSTEISRRGDGDYTVSLDLAPDMNTKQILCYPLDGLLRAELAANVIKQARADGNDAASAVKDFRIRVLSLDGVKHAKVCTGGLFTDDFCMETLELKLVKGLYAAGEALDVDGECGGHNLHWAFASGAYAVSMIK